MNNRTESSDTRLGIDLHSGMARPNDQLASIAGALDSGVSSTAKSALAIEDEARRKLIEASYGFLGNGALEKLQTQMAGIGSIYDSMQEFDPGYSFKEAAEKLEKSFLDSPNVHGISDEAFRAATQPFNSDAHEVLMTSGEPWMPPPFEDTPLGRAVFENTAHSKEVTKKVETLVGLVAGLNQTLVSDVLPAWFRQVEEDQKNAKVTFSHAAKQIQWAIVAVVVSTIVTVLATWWQVRVTMEVDRENAEQQKRTEGVLREQLAKQQQLIDQQAQDAAGMRAAITALKSTDRQADPQK